MSLNVLEREWTQQTYKMMVMIMLLTDDEDGLVTLDHSRKMNGQGKEEQD